MYSAVKQMLKKRSTAYMHSLTRMHTLQDFQTILQGIPMLSTEVLQLRLITPAGISGHLNAHRQMLICLRYGTMPIMQSTEPMNVKKD